MTTEQTQPRDRGRYSFKQQGAPTIELGGGETPLPPLPESVGTPEVSFDFNDAGKLETHVTVGGSTLSFWKDDMDGETTNSIESGNSDYDEAPWSGIQEMEDFQQARTWAEAVHERIEGATSQVMEDATGREEAREAILAFATGREPAGEPSLVGVHIGQPRPMSREELIVTGQAVDGNPAMSEITRMMHHNRNALAEAVLAMDKTHVDATVIQARQMFPGAKELRMRTYRVGDKQMVPTYLRTADDRFLGASYDKGPDGDWATRTIEGSDPGSIKEALAGVTPHSAIWDTDPRCEYDPQTEEHILYLDGRRSSAHTNG